MTRKSDRLLLVEGESDKHFFERVCRDLKLGARVQVAPPRDVGGTHNNKQGLLRHLPVLLQQLPDGALERLSVIVDADFKTDGGGYQRTFERIEQVLNQCSFTRKKPQPQEPGITFKHADGLPDLGVWIMPDNHQEGGLEDFVRACVSGAERPLFQHGQEVVAALPTPKFSASQRTKAEVASWLAWQRLPGRDLTFALEEDLLDRNGPSFGGFAEWLGRIYR